MGQCSSTSKQQRSKSETLERFDNPTLEEEEASDDISEPQLSVARPQRRAIDERTGRRDQHTLRDEDHGLAGVRPSLDEKTCTALLALRMGRGSSVGGLLSTVASSANTECALHIGEGCSPRGTAKGMDGSFGRVPQLRQPLLGKTRSLDSNDRLEQLLGSGRVGEPTTAPKIPAQG